MSTAEPDPAPGERPARGPRDHRDGPRSDGARPAGEPPPSVPILGSDQPAAAWVRRSVDSSSHMAAGWQFAITLLVFALGGWAADRWLGTTPWLLILGCAMGFSGALYSLVKRVPLSTRARGDRPPQG